MIKICCFSLNLIALLIFEDNVCVNWQTHAFAVLTDSASSSNRDFSSIEVHD